MLLRSGTQNGVTEPHATSNDGGQANGGQANGGQANGGQDNSVQGDTNNGSTSQGEPQPPHAPTIAVMAQADVLKLAAAMGKASLKYNLDGFRGEEDDLPLEH